MNRFDIDKKFTELVAYYLADGWILNTKSMCGHQGEEGKVDLVKGDELVRIWLSRENNFNWNIDGEWHGYIMHLRIGRWNRPASDSIRHNWTVWMRDLDVIMNLEFYEVSSDGDGWYVEDLDEALKVQEKRNNNWIKHAISFEKDITSARSKEIAVKYLKRVCGYKRVSSDKIVVKKNFSTDMNHAAYYVYYNGNSYRVY